MSSLQSNPWASGASYVSVGGLQKALKIAQSPGYGGLLLDTERSTERAATSSIEQIQHLKEIAKLDEKVNELQLDMQHKVALQNTADMTDPSSLDSMLKMLEELCNHLQTIMDKKQVLIGRLQEAYEDHLTVDANHHGEFVECFPLMAKQLSILSQKIESIIWTNRFSLKESHLNTTIRSLSSRLAELQSFYQALEESRKLMQSRIRQQEKENETSIRMKYP